MDVWQLPRSASLGGRDYPHRSDYRQILKLMGVLDDPQTPPLLRWYTALAYFYTEPIPEALTQQAMTYLGEFLTMGCSSRPGPRLLDWQQDAPAILSDINRVAGREIRELEYLHWWSFLGYFHGIGQGQLSLRLTIRDKLRRGKKLEQWEQEYYRENREQIALRKQDAPEKQRLLAMLAEAERSEPSGKFGVTSG